MSLPPLQPERPKMSTSLSASSIVVASRNQVSCDLKGEAAVLNLKNSVYYGLESVGAFVWNLVQRPRSVAELQDALLQEYDVEPARCESDLLGLLEKLLAEGLLEVKSEAIPSAGPAL
jgi:hypothetical protein